MRLAWALLLLVSSAFHSTGIAGHPCEKLASVLSINKACRCYSEDSHDHVWIGCTRGLMPEILAAFKALPKGTVLQKIWLWDNVMPFVPQGLFVNVSTSKVVLETSVVGGFQAGALQMLGPELKELELRNNAITVLKSGTFKNLTGLERLCISGNRLRSIDNDSFEDIAALVYLALQQNGISAIEDDSLAQLKTLKTLDVGYNTLRVISSKMFSGLANLETLSLERNQIEHIEQGAFQDLVSLKTLNLGGNRLAQFKVHSLPQLQRLYLSNNSIQSLKDIELGGCPRLRILHLDKNEIRDMSTPTLQKAPELIILSLTNNKISALTESSFAGLSSLETLSLQQNFLITIPTEAFSDTKKLQRLFLSHNRLASIGHGSFHGLDNLQILNLGHNSITDISPLAFVGLFSLEKLYMNNNKLSRLNNTSLDSLYSSLHTIDLSGNPWSCSCSERWLVDWFQEHSDVIARSQGTTCTDGIPFEEKVDLLASQCRPSEVTMTQIENSTSAWITGLAIALGTLSILILVGVGLMFYQDQLQQKQESVSTIPAGAPGSWLSPDMVKLLPGSVSSYINQM